MKNTSNKIALLLFAVASLFAGCAVAPSSSHVRERGDEKPKLNVETEPNNPAEEAAFTEVARRYRAATVKPTLPEDARKFKVQAEFALQEKQFDKAVELYGKALDIAPWWPEGHFNRALILGETKKYWDAMREMKRYLLLVPDASNARAAQDKIYQWEGVEIEARQDMDKAAKRKVYERKDSYCRSWPTFFWPASNHEQVDECEKLCVDAGGSPQIRGQFSCSFK